MRVIQRREALRRKLKRYFTGKPCRRGHVASRQTSNKTCFGCMREQRGANKQRRYEANADWRAKNPGWWRKYAGYPVPTRPAPLACEGCGKAQTAQAKVLDLDHCHETGKFRGWLCRPCNLGIGKLGDNLQGVLKAAAYLQRNQ